jgi:hypothetical protein
MNLYFVVEGKTEAKVYPAWLKHLLPEFEKIGFFDPVGHNTYKIFNAGGQPLYQEIAEAIEEVNHQGEYDYLVICLDAEENDVTEVQEDIHQFLKDNKLHLEVAQLVLVIQNRCLETWFLGNQKIYVRQPQNLNVVNYTRFYNVCEQDPELMGRYSGFDTHATFHKAYLNAMLSERGNLSYSEKFPGHTQDKAYLNQLQKRVKKHPDHLQTFQHFISFCNQLQQRLQAG